VTKSSLLPGISDHDGIPVVCINSKPSTAKQNPRKIFLYSKANIDELKATIVEISNDFKDKDVSKTDANTLWMELKSRLLQAVDVNIPSKMVRKRNFTPWLNHTLKRLHKRKQRAYNRARKSQKQEDWNRFRELRSKIKKATRKAYRGYIRDKFWNQPNNSGVLSKN
jgi:hypothetical protein